MVSPPSLRRSRRGKQVYSIGDKVEVVRSGGVDIGTITHKVSGKGTGSPANFSPRWMVTFDEGSQEEISEKGLGRIIGGADNSDDSLSNGQVQATSIVKPPAVVNNKEATANKVAAAKKPQPRKVRYEPPPQENKRVLTRAVRKQNGSATLHSGIEVARKKAPKITKGKMERNNKSSADETVITVKLLTGTLYMYRGAHPRAEFVRSV